ncbi:hypothetical protein MCUN1_001257 [Malassezia cuniculi]|uniref:Uncharacterized protein n=1 Tax=Malassezia cuniculi TaxID=948313 RepID=A0AAF0EPX4_9BASI|nr:hypothetical protein MCUN1_001257 [Malassezia cuniculi]
MSVHHVAAAGARRADDDMMATDAPHAVVNACRVLHDVWPCRARKRVRHCVAIEAYAPDAAGLHSAGRVHRATLCGATVDGERVDARISADMIVLRMRRPARPTIHVHVTYTTPWDGASAVRFTRLGLSAPVYTVQVHGVGRHVPEFKNARADWHLEFTSASASARATAFDARGSCEYTIVLRQHKRLCLLLLVFCMSALVFLCYMRHLHHMYTQLYARTGALAMALDINFDDGQWVHL